MGEIHFKGKHTRAPSEQLVRFDVRDTVDPVGDPSLHFGCQKTQTPIFGPPTGRQYMEGTLWHALGF